MVRLKKSAGKAHRKKVRKKDSVGKKIEVGRLKKELKEKERLVEEYMTKLEYMQADFENYKKRIEKEKQEYLKFANEGLILKIIDVYENLERAIENGSKSSNHKALLEGVEMTYRKLKDVLEEEGVREIKTAGEKFDPFLHESVMSEVNKDCEENTILEEFQRGYTFNNKVIRFSKVKVSKKQD